MDSNGEEGNFVYGYSMPFSGGVLDLEIDMEAFPGKMRFLEAFRYGEMILCFKKK